MSIRFFRAFAVLTILGILLGQAYAVYESQEAVNAKLPPLFGNFPHIQQALPSVEAGQPFSFIVAGDTKSTGTFEGLAECFKTMRPSFVVLLGDCVYQGTPEDHAQFRAECAEDFNFGCPTFYLPGNHDIGPRYTVEQFEADYGPSNFSFVYNDCLFVFLRALDGNYGKMGCIDYLRSVMLTHPEQYRKRFVFLHVPPVVSPDIGKNAGSDDQELENLFEEMAVDYVIGSHFHGYNRTQRGKVEYVVTGGGGAHLNETKGKQFHHAIALTVGQDFVSEKIIPASDRFDLEDWLNLNAVVFVTPLMKKYLWWFAGMDMGLVLLLGALLRPKRSPARLR